MSDCIITLEMSDCISKYYASKLVNIIKDTNDGDMSIKQIKGLPFSKIIDLWRRSPYTCNQNLNNILGLVVTGYVVPQINKCSVDNCSELPNFNGFSCHTHSQATVILQQKYNYSTAEVLTCMPCTSTTASVYQSETVVFNVDLNKCSYTNMNDGKIIQCDTSVADSIKTPEGRAFCPTHRCQYSKCLHMAKIEELIIFIVI
jgi:hypothetical protein